MVRALRPRRAGAGRPTGPAVHRAHHLLVYCSVKLGASIHPQTHGRRRRLRPGEAADLGPGLVPPLPTEMPDVPSDPFLRPHANV